MTRKIFCTVAWAISSCIFLWLLNLAQVEKSNPPSISELFNSFFLFSIMLLGGGACYHLLTEIALSPVEPNNTHLWLKLSWRMEILMTVLISAPVVVILCREYLDRSFSWAASYLYLLTAISVSLWLFTKAEYYFRQIRQI